MATRLKKLRITRVDRVAAGANPEAEVVLFKAAMPPHEYQPGPDGTCAECGKSEAEHESMSKAHEPPAESKEPAVADVQKSDLEARIAELEGTLKALDEMDVETLAALKGFEVAKSEPAEDEVLKGLPAEVRDRIEKAEAAQAEANERIAKMERERRVEQFTKAASEFENLGAPADLGPMLEELDRVAPEVAKSLTPVLKAANARIADGDLYAELGKSGAAEPVAKVDARAAEIRKENPDISKADALRRAMAESPDAAREAFTRK